MKVMRKVIFTSLILVIIIFACHQELKWHNHKNGRRYYLKHTCIQSHLETGTRTQLVGKMWTTFPYTYEVCDKYKVDTIWEKHTK
jgi:hypothetical protein